MKCPKCHKDRFIVYKTDSVKDASGKIKVIQYRKCKDCGITGTTSYDKWICELTPEAYISN